MDQESEKWAVGPRDSVFACGIALSPTVDKEQSCFSHNATKAAENKKGPRDRPQTFLIICAVCASLWLSSVLHARLGVFLEEVADINSEAFQLLIKSLS